MLTFKSRDNNIIMKKVFLIVVLFIFYISNAYADKEYLKNFNKFLSNNTKFISKKLPSAPLFTVHDCV